MPVRKLELHQCPLDYGANILTCGGSRLYQYNVKTTFFYFRFYGITYLQVIKEKPF